MLLEINAFMPKKESKLKSFLREHPILCNRIIPFTMSILNLIK